MTPKPHEVLQAGSWTEFCLAWEKMRANCEACRVGREAAEPPFGFVCQACHDEWYQNDARNRLAKIKHQLREMGHVDMADYDPPELAR